MSCLDENRDIGNIRQTTVLNAADIFRTCLKLKCIESTLYKSICKQFLKVNLHNISRDKYLHFAEKHMKNLKISSKRLILTFTYNFSLHKNNIMTFYLINPIKFTSS